MSDPKGPVAPSQVTIAAPAHWMYAPLLALGVGAVLGLVAIRSYGPESVQKSIDPLLFPDNFTWRLRDRLGADRPRLSAEMFLNEHLEWRFGDRGFGDHPLPPTFSPFCSRECMNPLHRPESER
jgi:hypothetical protein